MSLTPQDIQAKQFHVRFRGFDVEEVDGFLEQVAENFLMVLEENKAIQQKVETLTLELKQLKEEEHIFKNAMISAQSVADEMKKKSREEADALIVQTKEEVKKLKDDALKEITELEYQVDQLRGTLGNLQDDLRSVINDYLDMIDNPSDTLSSGQIDVGADEDGSPAMSASTALSESDVDLSDLYEKIDLPAEHPAAEDYTEEALNEELEVDAGLDTDVEAEEPTLEVLSDDSDDPAIDESGPSIPDLDDEIMFTLEDPLDDVNIDKK